MTSAVADLELQSLEARYGDVAVVPQPDGSVHVVLESVRLPPGWSQANSRIAFVLPVGYPAAQPDCFFAGESLRLASGALPQNAGMQQLGNATWLWFSWHLTSWTPGRDNAVTFAHFIESRLANAR